MRCSTCTARNLTKADFHVRGNGKLYKQCKTCRRTKIKSYYYKDKRKYIERAKKSNIQIKVRIQEEIDKAKDVPCGDCGKRYPPYVMDFDHRSNKKANVSDLKRYCSVQRVLEEIAKCDVVCANCHRERTYGPGAKINLTSSRSLLG